MNQLVSEINYANIGGSVSPAKVSAEEKSRVLFGCVVVVVDFALVVSLSSEIALLLILKVTMS